MELWELILILFLDIVIFFLILTVVGFLSGMVSYVNSTRSALWGIFIMISSKTSFPNPFDHGPQAYFLILGFVLLCILLGFGIYWFSFVLFAPATPPEVEVPPLTTLPPSLRHSR